ncbi:MAG: EAL domain-containing protein [Sphingomonadales bacterium]|nr:MAG: EAL domain-containing protein [Sphingomonadales bacterium]
MRIAKIGPDEDARLAALYEFEALSGEVDPELDEVVGLASRLFDVPIALVSLVDRTEQVFAARVGLDVCGTSRDVSFCAHALGSDDILVVPDATQDPRFAGNPLVTGDPKIRFYAGVPLRAASGHVLGSFCIIDRKPRNGLSAQDRKSLRQLARLALDRLEIGRVHAAGRIGQSRFQNIAATSPDAIVCADHDGRITFWNRTAERLFGHAATDAIGRDLDIVVPEHMRGGHHGGLQRVAAGGLPKLVGKTIELEALRKDGTTIPIELSLSMWHEAGRASFGAIMRDITERRSHEDRLFHLAHHDALTGLPNRTVVFRRTAEAMAADEPIHLLLVDLDGFKSVNDTIGHRAGDLLLNEVAARLLNCVQGVDTVARLGGDEFAVLMSARDPVASGPVDPGFVAGGILAALAAPFRVDGQPIHITASIGIASTPDHAATPEELLSNADLAMYQAKREGRRCHRVFTEALRHDALRRRAYEGELRRALDREEFVLFYQPQVDLADGRLIGAEALVRWQHPERGLLVPAEFLRAVEEGLLAVELGQWVLETACAQAAHWRARGWRFRMGVNLFEAQFSSGGLAEQVRAVLDRSGLPPAALELEITENIILRHDETMRDALGALHAEGVAIAFDDFGTGFASLSMLKAYPLSRLKIDRSFVENIGTDPVDAVIVSAVAALGSGLGLDVIAEGIETQGQCDLLRASGCRSGQGYLFGRPMPAAAFEHWMQAREPAVEREQVRHEDL